MALLTAVWKRCRRVSAASPSGSSMSNRIALARNVIEFAVEGMVQSSPTSLIAACAVAMRLQLAEIRRRGYAYSAQEHRLVTVSYAATTNTDTILAAVGVIAPLASPRVGQTVSPLRNAVAGITAAWQSTDDVEVGYR
jgi:DNA-binding IclR family transcriptional regulator